MHLVQGRLGGRKGCGGCLTSIRSVNSSEKNKQRSVSFWPALSHLIKHCYTSIHQVASAEWKWKTLKLMKDLYFTWVSIFLTAFYFYYLHFNTNICTFYSLHFQNWLTALSISLLFCFTSLHTSFPTSEDWFQPTCAYHTWQMQQQDETT